MDFSLDRGQLKYNQENFPSQPANFPSGSQRRKPRRSTEHGQSPRDAELRMLLMSSKDGIGAASALETEVDARGAGSGSGPLELFN